VEKENNIALENYTRRENLKFMNLREDRAEDCKGMIINLIQNDLKIDVTNVRFHAVHRVGKPAVGKARPIIARFVCREDRDLIWSRKKDLKIPQPIMMLTSRRTMLKPFSRNVAL